MDFGDKSCEKGVERAASAIPVRVSAMHACSPLPTAHCHPS